MADLVLKAETGRALGTRESRRLRREGKVPATVYGLDDDAMSVSVEWPVLRQAITTDAGLNALITLDIDGERQLSIVKDLQRHPVRRDVMHVDFIRIDAHAEVEVEIPIELTGEAREVTNQDGMVDHNIHSLLVWSLPDAIPSVIEVDISHLEIGDAVRVGDVELPEGVRTEIDPEDAIAVATVTRSTIEEMQREEEEAALEELAEALDADEGEAGPADQGDEADTEADSGDADGDE